MATAIGVNSAVTATLGSTVERATLAHIQTMICEVIEGPTSERILSATRRSKPVSFQGVVSRKVPRMRMMLSEKYCEVTASCSTMPNTALTTRGKSAVTVMWTGRVTHQKTIQARRPTAWAPGPVSDEARNAVENAYSAGPRMTHAILLGSREGLFIGCVLSVVWRRNGALRRVCRYVATVLLAWPLGASYARLSSKLLVKTRYRERALYES